MLAQQSLHITTQGRGCYAITDQLQQQVTQASITQGLVHVFVQHTSASLILCENADPQVQLDLDGFLADLIVDGDPRFKHVAEGSDDMPAHIRSILTGNDLTVPIADHRLALGVWQGVYLYEHRTAPQQRHLLLTLMQ
ncbi:MAG: YjbQ family protein [Legionellales bacterium]|nr:YjbQ family protein [Legionellales bacterium]